jgi:Holliday junction resolvasome RuvABC endonuclease subunit
MTVVGRTPPLGADVLIRTIDHHVAELGCVLTGSDLALAERLAGCLRQLVTITAEASAADRARVRVAVHRFVRVPRSRPLASARSLALAAGVVQETARRLGRPDLLDRSSR